jgi:immune inhibitor A
LEFAVKKVPAALPIILAVILVLCCCSIVILGGAYYAFLRLGRALPTLTANLPNSLSGPTPTPFQITRQPPELIPTETLKLLEQTVIPGNDLTELACRFKRVCNIAPTLPPPATPYSQGAQHLFWVNNEDANSYFQVHATLRYITPHSYFWVADNVQFNQTDIQRLMDAFENKIYPTDRAFFGSEWTPGVDDDPHIYILYTGGLGATVGGYFYSPDEYLPQIFQYSNAHEMFYISSSESLSDSYTYGSMAHELQHMIHWYQDRNETAFLNEGFSELASFINGYAVGSFDQIYLANPDINLTDWLGSSADNSAHYGASFLFVTYFLDRFGEATTKALVHNQQNGLDSLDGTLSQDNIKDPVTSKVVTADDFFLDWAITNFVQDGSVGGGRYVYHNYPAAPKAGPTETVTNCPTDMATRTVNQYGVDYIHITCPGKYSLRFEGSTSTRLLPVDPHSGKYAFWSNKGDLSDMTLTHAFDLTGISGPVTMDYWTWYDIEKDFDYVYVEASTDGQHWTILTTPTGTASNPNGASYGWGYTGQSNGWIQESIDLSRFSGQKISVRFEYLTDPAVNGEGFLLDDVSISAINYSTNFETGDNNWQTAGFARIENTVPQTFRLALISHASSGTTVQIIQVKADQSADIPFTIGQNGVNDVVLVVTGTTRFTRVVAPYQFFIH